MLAQDYLRRVQHAEKHRPVEFGRLSALRRPNPGLFRLEIEQAPAGHPCKRDTHRSQSMRVQKLPPGCLMRCITWSKRHKGQVQCLLTAAPVRRKLKRSGANLLAGRAWTLRLHPLSSQELVPDLRKALTIGTLPRHLSRNPSLGKTIIEGLRGKPISGKK